MECEKIRRHLSEYIDGTLDAETMVRVQEHLSSCKHCEQALDSLQTLVQELGDMEHIKAPDDFLEQIHDRMAKRFDLSALMKTLLIPFRVRIPYRFATAAAMAVLIFFIIHTPEIEKEMPAILTNQGEIHESTEVTDRDDRLGLSRVKEAQPPAPIKRPPIEHDLEEQTVPAPKKITSSKVALKRKKIPAKPKFNEPASIGESETIKAESKFAIGKAVRPVEIVLLLRPKVSMRDEIPQSYATDTMSTPEEGQSQGLRSSGAGRAAPMYSSRIMKKDSLEKEPSGSPAEEEPKQIEAPVSGDLSHGNFHSSLTELISSIKGSISATEYDKETGRPKFVNAEIPAEQYGTLREKLLQFGTLQSPTPVIEAKGLEPIKICIHLIHP